MLRYFTAGESHGPVLTAIIEGMPAGLPLSEEYIDIQLARRQQGYGRGDRMKIEKDHARILSGVRNGLTLGSPITLQIENKDWINWESFMKAGPVDDMETRRLFVPRPGHGDLAGSVKYGHTDLRNVLERASARETAARVAICTVARRLIEYYGIAIIGHVIQIGPVKAQSLELSEVIKNVRSSDLLCADSGAEIRMKAAIDNAKSQGDSLGGVFEIIAANIPIGLGSHVQWDRKLDARLAGALMSIQGIKGVEIGLGFKAAELPGSQVHDEIFSDGSSYLRGSNNAGGIEAGISNGQNIVLRAAMKPISTLYKPLRSVDLQTGNTAEAAIERSDICAVPAAAVVGEAVAAFELAQALVEKFGGDNIEELDKRIKSYRERKTSD